MDTTYEILTFDALSDKITEPMGTKQKYWLSRENQDQWLFKIPRENTGEHWAEKVAYELIYKTCV